MDDIEDAETIFDKFTREFGHLINNLSSSLFDIPGGPKGFITRTDERLEKIEAKIESHDQIFKVINLFLARDWKFLAGIFFVLAWIGYGLIKSFLFFGSFFWNK